jgi:hypothetical protein
VEHFLCREDELHQVETVDVQIFDEPRITMDLFSRDPILLRHQVIDWQPTYSATRSLTASATRVVVSVKHVYAALLGAAAISATPDRSFTSKPQMD